MQIEHIKSLLSQVSLIQKMYDKVNALSGENFNIFSILKLSTKEVRTHSAFIAELLNPKGSHGKGNVFLKLFLEELRIQDFSYDNPCVEIEKHIGFISQSGDNGGSIDIIITDINNQSIIIENKIYADDQDNQLLRYFNYGKKHCQQFHLLYLTLEGKEASDKSKGVLSENDYQQISYSSNIINWLDECHKVSSGSPLLRETIIQYINLIKVLTNQTINQEMETEIEEILKLKPEFIDTIPVLNSIADKIKSSIMEEIISQISNGFDDIIGTVNEIDFKIEVVSDSDGFAYCFFGFKGDEKEYYEEYKDSYLIEKRAIAKENGFQLTGWPFCWRRFNNYSTQLERLNYKELLLLKEPQVIKELRNELADSISFFKKIMDIK